MRAAFLAVAEEDYGRQIPFAFLERVQAEWKEKFADKAYTATAHSLDKTFGCAQCNVGEMPQRRKVRGGDVYISPQDSGTSGCR